MFSGSKLRWIIVLLYPEHNHYCNSYSEQKQSSQSSEVNQYHEVPYDAQMSRTKNRVLVRGQLTSLHAINYAITSAAVGTGLLYFGVNGYAAALGAANLFLYTSIYTPMKRVSILNTWIGSVGM